jgi:hypothetical protein
MKINESNLDCWVCVIFFACVCVGVSDSLTSLTLCVMCTEHFLGGVPGMLPLVMCNVHGSASIIFFWAVFSILTYLAILVYFSIFRGFLN